MRPQPRMRFLHQIIPAAVKSHLGGEGAEWVQGKTLDVMEPISSAVLSFVSLLANSTQDRVGGTVSHAVNIFQHLHHQKASAIRRARYCGTIK